MEHSIHGHYILIKIIKPTATMPGQGYYTLKSFLVWCTYFHSGPYNSDPGWGKVWKNIGKSSDNEAYPTNKNT